MDQQKIIQSISIEVRGSLEGEGSGHDWSHVERVWKMAKHIGEKESADIFVVELAALLHDVADWKFHDGDDTVGPKMAREIMSKHSISEEIITHVCGIIERMSFKGVGVETAMETIEGEIVQDADRLDAIGAIGVARTFTYGGNRNRPMYDPQVKPVMHNSKEEYFKNQSPTINHFYEKLLFLKDRMNTSTAKEIAEGRHEFMETFLAKFLGEWEGRE